MAKAKSKKDEVLISFLLDRTGSMASIAPDVIGGFNAFIDAQADQKGKAKFILTLFDSQSVDVTEYDDVKDVPHLTTETYQPRAGTPLLDAIGKTIDHVRNVKKLPKKVLFVVYTDGEENASNEYKLADVKALIDGSSWDFIFLGCDIDAYAEAGSFGFAMASTVSLDNASTPDNFTTLTQSASSYRAGDADYMNALKAEEKKQAKAKKA